MVFINFMLHIMSMNNMYHDIFSFVSGDWHCAYILLYGPRILEVLDEEAEKKPAEETKMETE